MRYKALDLFSGCGGLSEGFLQAGFDVAVSIEIDEKACETQRKNHPETIIIQGDLTELNPQQLEQETQISNYDLIIGGPPCQGFSTIGTRLGTSDFGEFGEDPRNSLYKEFVKYVRYYQPKMFLMENVPGLYTMQDGAIRENIENDFSHDDPEGRYVGYNVTSTILRAVEFGVPQKRERVFFVGIRNDFEDIDFQFPEPFLNENEFYTVNDAIGDLPALGVRDGENRTIHQIEPNSFLTMLNENAFNLRRDNNYEEGYIYNHLSRYNNPRDREIFRRLAPFQKLRELNLDEIAEYLRANGYQELPVRLRNGFDDFYRKLDWERPSPTIIAHLHKDGLAFIHPDGEQARSLSIREAARLQSFPDNFIFQGSQSHMFKQIGNAVPPLLAYHLANALSETLNNITEFNIQTTLAFE
ncbi:MULTISPECIES: DNA cytosine methyltransferase [Bacillus]|uniref:DNA cytosine methyltransferase n=1 Tax=Bacillus TaxID=1386 RepID=UPI0007D06059|nr:MULTISPECIES: DNA cytosine methyltransferase [Bacillus]MBO3652458.1 DNA cytosine methyltransferase [Bacillus amyloliquefaciens]MCE4939278.1 DNA cytosine methyltransferase [Bacillus velezensis]MCJ2176500.1 DNA cytosine methyltransferase [Bacillus amyloliquefaciens]MCR4350973.1 DNA cytosine methyltransferase [Bacillus amyloliquefaciens]MCR4359012.1 DNA cytosine methyltransferase [Bacillus amyloliquefaciens]